MHNRRESNHLRAALLLVALGSIALLAFLGYPTIAVYLLSVLCAANAVSRLVWRDRNVWNAGKSWKVDVIFYLALALGLAILAPMAQLPAAA